MNALKKALIQRITSLLDDKIRMAEKAVKSARESRDIETKCTVGDKHETGRAMSQIELDNAEFQLNKVLDLKRYFLQLDFEKENTSVSPGCLVRTEDHTYLIAIGLGKIQVDNKECFVISIQSPIGKAMLHKNIGETVSFINNDFEIKAID